MAKTRKSIPKAVREAVLNEFDHHCAVCPNPRPQLHHIDGDTTNCDPMNLIPLCPNRHLTDVHNPTKPIDRRKLQLLRRFKDPTVLEPQFEPLFRRMCFLFDIEKAPFDAGKIEKAVRELVGFVRCLEMGQFYSDTLGKLLSRPGILSVAAILALNEPKQAEAQITKYAKEFRDNLLANKDEALILLVELLRYQRWSSGNEGRMGNTTI